MLNLGSTIILNSFEQKPKIIVFFKDSKKEEEIKALESQLAENPTVATVKYVSKEEALMFYNEEFKDDEVLLEMVSADILPASLEVSAVKIEYLQTLADLLRQESDIQELVYQEDVINLLVSWTTTFRNIGIVAIIFLSLVSVFTVVTVVGMKIAVRKEEIEILQLVGASNWYIRLPFMFEGIFYGLLGAFMGWLATSALILYLTPKLADIFVGTNLFPIPNIFYAIYLGGMLLTGFILGAISSTLAINRYLR